jgi:hypothetical protein
VLVRGGEWCGGLLLYSDDIEAVSSFGFWLGPVVIGYVAIATIGEVWAELVSRRWLAAAMGELLVFVADRVCPWLRPVGG